MPDRDVTDATDDTATEPAARLRARLVTVTVQAQIVADDGENLLPVATNPVTVAAPEWQFFSLDLLVANVQHQLNERAD